MPRFLKNTVRLLASLMVGFLGTWLWIWQDRWWNDISSDPMGENLVLTAGAPEALIYGAQVLAVICTLVMTRVLYRHGHGGKLSLFVLTYWFTSNVVASGFINREILHEILHPKFVPGSWNELAGGRRVDQVVGDLVAVATFVAINLVTLIMPFKLAYTRERPSRTFKS